MPHTMKIIKYYSSKLIYVNRCVLALPFSFSFSCFCHHISVITVIKIITVILFVSSKSLNPTSNRESGKMLYAELWPLFLVWVDCD